MKLRYILTSLLACLALAVGCVQEELPHLSDLEATPSYFTFSVDGGSKDVTVTTSSDWTVTDIPEWVTVNPASGKGNGKFTVNVAASTDTLARAAYLKVNAGKETQLVTVNQDAFIPDFPEFKGGDYWIVFDGGAAIPLSSAYGYLYTAPVNKDEAGKITSTAQNIFTFTAVEGGFTIQDPSKQYYCMQGTYDSFNVYSTLPETGGVWTVKQVGSAEYEIVNVANGKKMQYDPAYSSAGAYSSERGLLANLVKVEVIPEPEPLGDATEIKDATEIEPEIIVEGLVTASSTKGVIVTDKTGSLLVYGINSEVKVGDALKVKGNLSSYNKGYQLANPYQYEIASSDNKIEYPEPVVLKADAIAEMVKPTFFLAQYASVTGRVSVDSYNNALIKVGQYTVKTYYSHDSYADFADKGAEICGYVVAYKESSKEVSMVVTSIKEVELPSYSIDGKQWKFYWEDFEMLGLLDMGVTAPGKMVLAFQYDGDDFYTPYVSSEYVIEEVDEVSGKVIFEEWGEEVVLEYSELSESSVVITCDYEWIYDAPCTLAETLETIQLEEEGGFKPGAYYITTEGGMFAMPVAEEYTYGYLKVTESVSSSLVFTIEEYDADFGSYTIKDSYGRYLYQTEGKTFTNYNVSTEFDEAEWGYQWFVQPNDDGTYTIKNAGTYYYMQYDPNYSSFGCYEDERGSLPVLIPAE